jgi:signal transduction histidine kinase
MKHQGDVEPHLEGPVPEPAPDRSCVPVLLVDDDGDNLTLLEHLLDGAGLTLVRAQSGEEALRAVLAWDFAAILLDVRMPGMDGFETAEIIRTRPKARHVPIIFVTGLDATPEHLARGYSAGAVDYLFRPFSPDILLSKIRFFVDIYCQRKDLADANRNLRSEIAERRRLEAERDRMSGQLLQGQKLQAIGQLAAGIAHEINNPVGYILSNLGSVRKYLTDLTPLLQAAKRIAEKGARGEDLRSEIQDFEALWKKVEVDFLLEDAGDALADCQGGAERIRDIVRSLKQFAHPDESTLRPADLVPIIRQAVALCLNELKYRVNLHEDYEAVGSVVCYPQQIEQVLVNLLVNAAQAMGSERGDVFLEGRREGSDVILRVRDTGSGIAPEHLSRLFEPFFTTKPIGKGTGLGLHVAYKIMKAHGGHIDVASELGKGATFTLRLPADGPRSGAG